MNNFIKLPQRVNGKIEDILLNMNTVERIIENFYNENQCILILVNGNKLHISLSLQEIENYICYNVDNQK